MNAAGGNSFDVASFVPTRLLGEGVWGRVYDLGDGTVLKIAREQCAGIGSGRAKIENECEGLTLLAAAGVLAGLVPVVRGRGDIPSSSPLAREGFAVWLRMTKVSGRTISADDIDELSRHEQSRIGGDLGVVLARVHAGLRHALAVARRSLPAVGAVETYADVANAAARLGDPFYMDAVAQLTRARCRIPSEVCATRFTVTSTAPIFLSRKMAAYAASSTSRSGVPISPRATSPTCCRSCRRCRMMSLHPTSAKAALPPIRCGSRSPRRRTRSSVRSSPSVNGTCTARNHAGKP
jgi:hypothetical protein